MKKIFEVLVKPSRLILLIASIVYICLYMVGEIGSIGGGFLDVLGSVIVFVLTLAALTSIPVLLLLKKDEAAKLVFFLVSGYWLITANQSYLFFGTAVNSKDALLNTTGVFGFLVGLFLAAVLVLLVLHFILKKEVLKLSAVLSFLLSFLLLFVFFVLYFIVHVKYNYAWTGYLDLFARLTAPVAIFFGYLYFLGAPDYEFPQKAPKEEKPVEQETEAIPVEEPSQDEEVQPEETPAEESSEEKPE